MKQIICVDWLQLYCTSDALIKHKDYLFTQLGFQSKQFRVMYEVIYRGEEFAHISMVPTSPIIPANTVIIKFKNRQLYGQNLVGMVNAFLSDCNLKFISITRLDLALDLNYFNNKLQPETFIDRFMKSDYLKIGRGKYTLIGEQKHTHSYQYLRFGQKTADVNVYLYNKTIELKQVQDKPYIRKIWKKAGLDTVKDVWRLEISIKGKGANYLDKSTGAMEKITYTKLDQSNYISELFFSYIQQYFRFCKNDGQKNKCRMKPLNLFEKHVAIFKPLYLPSETGSNRSDRIFVKKLYLMDQELRDMNDNSLEAQREVLSSFIQKTGLVDYLAKRKGQWDIDAHREF